MPTTQDIVIAKLKSWGRVQPSDKVNEEDLRDYADGALAEHNSTYSYATLPNTEFEPVVILAWIRLTDFRASQISQTASTSAAGFSADRDTPFSKLLKFNDELRKRYDAICTRLGLSGNPTVSDIVVSNNRVKDARTDQISPDFAAVPPPPITLSEDLLVESEMSVSWTFPEYDQLDSFILLQLTSDTATIADNANYSSVNGIPRTNNEAVIIGQFYQMDLRALKVEGIDRSKRQRFMIIARSVNNLISYSNELVVEHS